MLGAAAYSPGEGDWGWPLLLPSWDFGVAGGEHGQFCHLALLGCSSRGGTGGCHLLQPLMVHIVARVGCKGWGVLGRVCPCPVSPSQINLLIFMRILKVILAKLRANQKGYADYKLR